MITREDLVEQSITDYLRTELDARGYTDAEGVVIEEAFPQDSPEETQELAKQHIAIGLGFDDGGEQAEMGSDLVRRVYTLIFFVFGTDQTWARNLANVVRDVLTRDGRIPLKDYAQAGAPIVDYLILPDRNSASVERQIIPEPEPWQEHVWSCTLRVADEYFSQLV